VVLFSIGSAPIRGIAFLLLAVPDCLWCAVVADAVYVLDDVLF
jgi:hypothetical protein